ncbi:MAG: UDP-N-acetylglucosamine 2-epimerase (non-hydrolyzing) [Thermodesulfobacteriota bacterium]|nr:MAG: UDP-N-acetylglucosamine 2-epimerase (non-hydrolyzing) [Thermodesulfobacteriota bacterium]
MRLQTKILSKEELQDKICVIVGTRPGIIMFSPIIRELKKTKYKFFVIHTGQHYSYNMDKKFFEDLNLPEPEYKLENIKNCKFHGEQTAKMLEGIEKILLKEKPKIVLVGGDANCNLAGALAARKLHIKVGHVEAGERSYDWRMPEEHNRRMIDHISEYLFCTNEKSKQNLLKENVLGKIFVTGNPIVDAAYQNREIAKEKSNILEQWNLKKKDYFILTTHREENVDSKENLENIILGMKKVCERFKKKIIFLAHPRTQKRIEQFGLNELIKFIPNFIMKDAIGYLDFINLLSNAKLVFTDSGGVQQEACIFKVPCVTLRENTEWVETIELGVNILAGTNPDKIVNCAEKMLLFEGKWGEPFGDGKAAERIVYIISKEVISWKVWD